MDNPNSFWQLTHTLHAFMTPNENVQASLPLTPAVQPRGWPGNFQDWVDEWVKRGRSGVRAPGIGEACLEQASIVLPIINAIGLTLECFFLFFFFRDGLLLSILQGMPSVICISIPLETQVLTTNTHTDKLSFESSAKTKAHVYHTGFLKSLWGVMAICMCNVRWAVAKRQKDKKDKKNVNKSS